MCVRKSFCFKELRSVCRYGIMERVGIHETNTMFPSYLKYPVRHNADSQRKTI